MNKNYCIVLSTFDNEENMKNVISSVLENKLAACVQTIDIGSHYRWKGKLCRDKEILVLFKTRRDKYEKLLELVKTLHSYETPEIISLDILDGNKEYLSWIDESIS